MLSLNDSASMTRTITEDDINKFAELVGDKNPLHMDKEFAANSRFGGIVAHGMWGGSLISAVLGERLPGPGTIYLSQELEFIAPVYPGDQLTAEVTVLKINSENGVVTLDTQCRNQTGELLIKGKAVVLFEKVIHKPR